MKIRFLVLLFVVFLGYIFSGCASTPTPEQIGQHTLSPTDSSTSMLSPTPTFTLTVELITPTQTPTPSPSPFPTPSSTHQLIVDFQTPFGIGAAEPENVPDNSLEYELVPEGSVGNIAAKLDYKTPNAWAAFWIELDAADFSPYDTLTFFARGDSSTGIPPKFKVELKRQNDPQDTQVVVSYLAGLTDDWQQLSISLDKFRALPDESPLCGWDKMNELVFTFEIDNSGEKGRVYLDDIYVERRGEGAPPLRSECVSASTPIISPTLTTTSTALLTDTSVAEVETDTSSTHTSPAPIAPTSLLVADFDSGAAVTGLGGAVGAAYNAPDILTETVVLEQDRGYVVKLEYKITAWSAFWIKLQGADLTPYNTLVFDVRADPETAPPREMKIELKRANGQELSIIYVSGITNEWQTMDVDLSDFGPAGFNQPLSSFTQMEELVFTFDANRSGLGGIVYFDNIVFKE